MIKQPLPHVTRGVIELYSQDIAKVLRREPSDVLAISVFNMRDYELAQLLQLVYNKGISDALDHDTWDDKAKSQYD
jgi:hypothetical protein